MATENINMPQLGESVTEGTISTWLVKAGEHVNKYDPIAEVMTDKVNAEVPSSFTGTIKELAANEGDTIQVGELMCYIETEEETDTSNSTSKPDNENKEDKKPATEDVASREDQSKKKRYSPAVLRLAQDRKS